MLSIGSNVGQDITQSAKQMAEAAPAGREVQQFKDVDGLRLPSTGIFSSHVKLPSGSTTVTEWDLSEDQINNNIGLDPQNFEVK